MGLNHAIDITADQHKTILRLVKAHLPKTDVWAYGSRVKWTSRPQSDLDLVVFSVPEQRRQVSDLREAFEESDLPFRVDVLVWEKMPKSFREEIEEEHAVLVEGLLGTGDDGWRNMAFTDAVVVNPRVQLQRGQAYPFVAMADVTPGVRCTHAGSERQYTGGGSRFQCGDTLMARITPSLENGKIARYCSDDREKPAHGSTEFIVIRGRPSVTDNTFAYYLTRWQEVRDYAVGQMTGTSGRQRVPVGSLRHFPVSIPPISEQRTIARILGTLDDKIELNRRMNETLEEMARALFRSWFVDFDPVRAKMEGRGTGLPEDIADLFPDRLVKLAGRNVPKGWEVGTVGAHFRLTMGQSPPGSTYNEHGEGLPFFQGKTDFGFRYPENRKHCSAPVRVAEPEDTLVSVRAPVGHINMAWERCCIGRGVAGLRHKSDSSSFTYYTIEVLQTDIQQYEHTGTVFGAINKRQFEDLLTTEPTVDVVDAFSTFAVQTDSLIRSNEAEARTLAVLRDMLQSMLISGNVVLEHMSSTLVNA